MATSRSEAALPAYRNARKLGRQPAFDGLRGAAWLVVFVAHANLIHSDAFGQVAMFVFFALSGFLITLLIVQERAANGRVSLRNFFARRALRLLPALVFFLVVWLLVVALFGSQPWMTTVPGGGPGTGISFTVALQGVGAALAYVTNWFEIFHLSTGYVPLGHLWSLAVEEQFYLMWAPLLVLVLSLRRRIPTVLTATLMVASFVDVVVVHGATAVTEVVDMGTDTRAGAFLAGALAALCWNRRHLWLSWLRERARVPAIVLSLGFMAWAGWVFDHRSSAGTFAVAWIGVSLAAALLVVALVDERAERRTWLLTNPVLIYLGQRSYALYLWHYVWLTWLRSMGLIGIVGAFVASLACAEISWRLVESPALGRKHRFSASPQPTAPPTPQQTGQPTGHPVGQPTGQPVGHPVGQPVLLEGASLATSAED